jgi:ABC-type thiamine transport system ATPase subunit
VFSDAISKSFVAHHRKMVRDNAILLVTLDRIAIGPILRSNLVFLVNVSCEALSSCEDALRRTILPRMCGH